MCTWTVGARGTESVAILDGLLQLAKIVEFAFYLARSQARGEAPRRSGTPDTVDNRPADPAVCLR